MTKIQLFDALQMYKDNLSHAQSPLYGKQNPNAKYYKRIGTPGKYRYFQTKEEYDTYLLNENIRKNKEREEAIARENQARNEALKKQRLEEQHKKEREQSEALARALERNVNPINAQQDREKAIWEAYQREQERRREAQEKINQFWLYDSDSPLAQIMDIRRYVFPENSYNWGTFDLKISQAYKNYNIVREETEDIDPATGLYIKNYEIPIEKEIMMVNPGFMYSSNSGGNITAYNENCYACTTAMVLREKGYDVIAGKDYNGIAMDGTDRELGIEYDDLFTGNFSSYKKLDTVVSELELQGPGAYGDLNMKWNVGILPIPGLSYETGHSIFYKIDNNGEVHFYDCQEGKETTIADMKEMEDYLFVVKSRYRYKRLDNQDVKNLEKLISEGIIQ